jgi:hypothetical protein
MENLKRPSYATDPQAGEGGRGANLEKPSFFLPLWTSLFAAPFPGLFVSVLQDLERGGDLYRAEKGWQSWQSARKSKQISRNLKWLIEIYSCFNI